MKKSTLSALQKRIASYPGLGDPRAPGERDFLVPEQRPDQFLYGRQGPWPQPSPAHPLGEAPAVIAVPPLGLTPGLEPDVKENRKILEHLHAGGVTSYLYGGNANPRWFLHGCFS